MHGARSVTRWDVLALERVHQLHNDRLVSEIAHLLAGTKLAGYREAWTLCGGSPDVIPEGVTLEMLIETYRPAARLLVERASGRSE